MKIEWCTQCGSLRIKHVSKSGKETHKLRRPVDYKLGRNANG